MAEMVIIQSLVLLPQLAAAAAQAIPVQIL
jgi:hypothetical protein